MPIQRTKKAIRHIAHKAKVKTHQWVAHFLEFLMVLASLFWAVEAHAEKAVPLKNLRPQFEASQVNSSLKPPASRRPASADSSQASSKAYPKNNGLSHLTVLTLDSVLNSQTTLRAPESIASGRYLPQAFRESPYYVSPAFQVLRFPGPRGR